MYSNPYNPEFCFTMEGKKVCIPIFGSPSGPFDPLPSSESDPENWTIIRNPQGEITRAGSCGKSSERLLFDSRVESDQRKSTKFLSLSRNGESFLTIGGRVHTASDPEKQPSMSRQSIFAKGEGIDYQLSLVRETFTSGHIVLNSNGSTIEKPVDFIEPSCETNDPEMGLCRALTDDCREKLEPFRELLTVVNDYYWNAAREDLAALPALLKNPNEGGPGPQAEFWCKVARAGCLGGVAALAAACCVETAGVGCIYCAAAAGATGSLCPSC